MCLLDHTRYIDQNVRNLSKQDEHFNYQHTTFGKEWLKLQYGMLTSSLHSSGISNASSPDLGMIDDNGEQRIVCRTRRDGKYQSARSMDHKRRINRLFSDKKAEYVFKSFMYLL